jgi:hypothetical protein
MLSVLNETVIDVQNDRNSFIFKAKKTEPVFLHCLTLKLKEKRYFETLVTIHQSTRGNTPEDLNLQQYPRKNPKLANPFSFYVLSPPHCHILSARNTSRNSAGTRPHAFLQSYLTS